MPCNNWNQNRESLASGPTHKAAEEMQRWPRQTTGGSPTRAPQPPAAGRARAPVHRQKSPAVRAMHHGTGFHRNCGGEGGRMRPSHTHEGNSGEASLTRCPGIAMPARRNCASFVGEDCLASCAPLANGQSFSWARPAPRGSPPYLAWCPRPRLFLAAMALLPWLADFPPLWPPTLPPGLPRAGLADLS